MLHSLMAGIARVVLYSQLSVTSVSFEQNTGLRVITSAAIGGASFSGGSGTILGTTLGVIFLAMVANDFNMTRYNTYWFGVVTGVMLLLALFPGEYLKRHKTSH